MRITFLGGAEEIGASCAVVDIDQTRLLVDCGQRLGAPPGQALPDFSFLESGPPITAILLTHSHADHVGALPALEPALPEDCPIYATRPTIALVRVMLEDSVRIMREYSRAGSAALFSPLSVAGVSRRFTEVRWGKSLKLGAADVTATWYPAGHVLGAGMIEIKGKSETVLFSGDVSVANQLSVPGVFVPDCRPDVLVLESTYGNRLHAHRPTQERRIIERVGECIAAGGHVLFPTFALGRAQEVLLLMAKGIREGDLPQVPVFADGLVRAISKVYARFPDDLSQSCRRLWEQGLDPIFPEDLPLRAVRNQQQRETIGRGGPCIIVSSSGMLQGGASQYYARQWMGQRENLILITGYQDEESPGQALLNLAETPPDQPRFFKLEGVRTEVACAVENWSLSAHADNGELSALAAKLRPQLILPVHGDSEARQALAKTLMATSRAEVILPFNGQTYGNQSKTSATREDRFRRPNPLAHWPPWDTQTPSGLDLPAISAWINSLEPKITWITLDELAELWKSPDVMSEDDWRELRRAIYEQSQPYFIPDPKRPFLLGVRPIRADAPHATQPAHSTRLAVERASLIVRELFPNASGLRRFGFFPEEQTIRLEFQFPRSARRHYVQRTGELVERTGWQVEFNDNTDDVDLVELVHKLLEFETTMAIDARHDTGKVRVLLPELPENVEDIPERFFHRAGYTLELLSVESPLPTVSQSGEPITVAGAARG